MLQLIRDNRLDDAIAEGKKRLKENPKDHDARYALGIAYLVAGDLPAAIKALKKVLDKRPKDYQCAGNLGVTYQRSEDYPKAIYTLKKALKINSDYEEGRYNLGCAYFDDEQFDEALKQYEKLNKQSPENPKYLCSIADAHRQLAHWQKAVGLYRSVIELDETFHRAHLNLGAILLHTGFADTAKDHCQRAVELEPSDVKSHKNLADCLVQTELLDEAMESYANAFEIDDSNSELCAAIGKVWQETGDIAEASSWFDKAVQLDDKNTEAKCGLAKIIADSAGADAALTLLEPLLKTETANPELCLTLSDIYWDDGEAELAMEQLKTLEAAQPDRLQVQMKIANILSSSGDVDGAIDLYHAALDKNPTFVPALNGLATSKKGKLAEEQVQAMENMITNNPEMKSGIASSLHSGLAYYYDGKKTAEKAAHHMREANRYQWEFRSKRDWNYEPDQQEEHISSLINIFDKSYFEKYGSMGHSSVTPVFIVAMPRSGTTLTEQILARHSKVLGIGERPFASQSFQGFNQGFNPKDTNNYFNRLNPESLHDIAEQYLARLQKLIDKAAEEGITHVVDKMPDNYSMVGWILTLFPNAKIIHAGRDPRDVALSCWITQFGSIPWACQPEHIVKRIEQYQRIMKHWDKVLGNRMYQSSYEDLVANQELRSKEMIEFIGLDWEEECLSFYKSDRLVRTASITQVRQPIYINSVAKWEKYLPFLSDLLDPLNTPSA